jgi:penicillin amidase
MVGVTIAGIPGIIVGRNDHVALGVTNAYADVQDLFIEKVDPDNPENFLEGTESLPFGKIQETLKIRDKSSESGFRREKITIRTTNRGPVISDPGGYFPKGSVVTVRWAALESMAPEIGIKRIMSAGSVEEVDSALAGLTMLALNFVFADDQGNIGWRVSGKIPVRDKNNSPLPVHVTDSRDNWKGWIPFELNPHSFNPERGWVGTCNHYTPEPDYPYYYTAHAAPTGRYLRLKELMRDQTRKGPEDHWAFQRDTINPPARELTPVFLSALKGDERFDQIVDILEKWDFSDRADSQGALIFHYMDENFAQLVFQDELGEQVSSRMLNNWYFWRERFLSMIRSNDSSWFDDKNTPNVVETRDEMIRKAAIRTINELSERFGPDPHGWNWGKAHVVEFVNPLRRSGFGKELFGAESFEMAGSVDTLYRAMYEFGEPTPVTITASLRMVADLGDKDKVMAVIPGGVAARTFHEHFNDQLKDFMTGAKLYWPFSDKGIKEHSVETLKLTPAGN